MVLTHGNRVDTIQQQMHTNFDDVSRYIRIFKLQINPLPECDPILLQSPLRSSDITDIEQIDREIFGYSH